MSDYLVPGGLYVILFIRSNPGEFHWGLYLHYETQSHVDRVGTRQYAHRGHKYHIRNMMHGWIADHEATGGVLKSNFLAGLMRIGVIHQSRYQAVHNILTSKDAVLNLVPGIDCIQWTLNMIMDLVSSGYLSTQSTRDAIEGEIHNFGQSEWQNAANAVRPRPIIRSRLIA